MRPVIDFALFYTRKRYSIDFRTANPAGAIAKTQTPMLIIGDEKDVDILPHHAEDLAKLNLSKAELWMVKGAAHGGAWGANPTLFERRVTDFFRKHD
jgi:uncharacterized protein